MAFVPLNDDTPLDQYTATGGQTTFPYTWLAFSEADIKVYVNGTLKTLTTDYTISAVNQENGANVVFNSGLTLNDAVTITRNISIARTTGYTTSGSFRAETLNIEQNKVLAICQQLERDIGRCVRLSDFSTIGGNNLILPVPTDGRAWVWDGATGLIRNSTSSITNLETVGTIVSDNITNINTVATNIADVNTVAGDTAEIGVVATNIADITTVADNIADLVATAALIEDPLFSTLTLTSGTATYTLTFTPTSTARLLVFVGGAYRHLTLDYTISGNQITFLDDYATGTKAYVMQQSPDLTSGGGGSVTSVNSQTGVVVLDADDIDDTSTTNKFATAAELALIAAAVQPGDNISDLTNDAGYITSPGNAFTTFSVSGQSDVVADSASDTLTFVAGSNVTITTNAATDSITIAATGSGGASQLSDLSDVTSAGVTNRNVLAADGSAYVGRALEAADIQSGTFVNARIAQGNVTQHQAALSITESQISDLQSYLLPADIGSTVQGYDADTAKTDVAQQFTAAQYAGATTLTDAATITWDMSATLNDVTVTLGGNRTLGAPTNTNTGQKGILRIVQDGTGSRTLSFNSVYKFPGGTAPTLTTTAAAVDKMTYHVISSSVIECTFLADYK